MSQPPRSRDAFGRIVPGHMPFECNCQPDRLSLAAPDLLAALKDGLSLKGGWREAIVELEDWCHEPVRLKNMLAAADQLDRWATAARAAIAKAEGAP